MEHVVELVTEAGEVGDEEPTDERDEQRLDVDLEAQVVGRPGLDPVCQLVDAEAESEHGGDLAEARQGSAEHGLKDLPCGETQGHCGAEVEKEEPDERGVERVVEEQW